MEAKEDDPLIGTLIAERYRVTRKLGEGGMGVVYLAVHEALRKPVALKLLATSGRIDREAVARFEREAIAAANLKHPNIAEATDFGRLPDGALYLVMEYVEGRTLRRILREHGRLAPERALSILQQVGAALATAHAHDVVHRDLKPENIVVTTSLSASIGGAAGPAELVKVIDFGIAKIRNATFGGGATGLTKAGTVFGTPEYMAPEQVMGLVVDSRCDQYALGVLAFEVLTGKAPFKADDIGQLMMMHVGAPVPSTRDSTPALPLAVDAVVMRMLAKMPDERFATVSDAMQALGAAFVAPAASSTLVEPVSSATVKLGTPAGREASMPSWSGGARSMSTSVLAAQPHTLRSVAIPPSGQGPATVVDPPGSSVAAVSVPHASVPSGGTYAAGSIPGLSATRATTTSKAADRKILYFVTGSLALLFGVLVVMLVARSCSGPPGLSPEVTAAIADWRGGKIDPSSAAIRAAIEANPKIAENDELAQALAAQVGNDAARRSLESLLDTTALGKSKAMAAALATMAVKDERNARDAALDLLRERQDLLSKEQGARVRLRDAPDCKAFETAQNEAKEAATTATSRDLERLTLGECEKMLRVDDLCDECKGGGRGKGPPGQLGPGPGKGKGKKDKGKKRDD